jgi:hypothetical protein
MSNSESYESPASLLAALRREQAVEIQKLSVGR